MSFGEQGMPSKSCLREDRFWLKKRYARNETRKGIRPVRRQSAAHTRSAGTPRTLCDFANKWMPRVWRTHALCKPPNLVSASTILPDQPAISFSSSVRSLD